MEARSLKQVIGMAEWKKKMVGSLNTWLGKNYSLADDRKKALVCYQKAVSSNKVNNCKD